MAIQQANVSVTVPVEQAIERVKVLLFRPFDISRWFTIGFCAWLAGLGERGFGGNFNLGSRNGGGPDGGNANFHEQLEHAKAYVANNLMWIVPLAIILVVFCIALGVVMLWLNSRGKFMFLHCVALQKAEIDIPWHKFARQGNSLFLFRLVLGLIAMVPSIPFIVMAILLALKMYHHDRLDAPDVLMFVCVVLMLIVLGVVFGCINKLTKDFVVPIMFLRGNTCLEAWMDFLGLLSVNVAHFVVYLLFQIVLGLAVVALVLITVLVTCCIAGCLLILPYLGAVLLLPVLVFSRSYSLYYFGQYGDQYNVFLTLAVSPPSSASV